MSTDIACKVRIDADPWLSAMLGRPVFRAVAHAESDLSPIAEHKAVHANAMYWSKVAGNHEDAHDWRLFGFRCVNQQVTLATDAPRTEAKTRQHVEITQPTADQQPDILRIAESCFHLSRFHVDENIPTGIANRIKREWAMSCLTGKRGDRVFVACIDKVIVGFLASLVVKQDGRSVAVIDLVGVDQDAQGKGVGSALVHAFIEHYVGQCDELRVGTQSNNSASLRLYENFGFEIVETFQVFHLHTQGINENQ